jgi:hypothetical protein
VVALCLTEISEFILLRTVSPRDGLLSGLASSDRNREKIVPGWVPWVHRPLMKDGYSSPMIKRNGAQLRRIRWLSSERIRNIRDPWHSVLQRDSERVFLNTFAGACRSSITCTLPLTQRGQSHLTSSSLNHPYTYICLPVLSILKELRIQSRYLTLKCKDNDGYHAECTGDRGHWLSGRSSNMAQGYAGRLPW